MTHELNCIDYTLHKLTFTLTSFCKRNNYGNKSLHTLCIHIYVILSSLSSVGNINVDSQNRGSKGRSQWTRRILLYTHVISMRITVNSRYVAKRNVSSNIFQSLIMNDPRPYHMEKLSKNCFSNLVYMFIWTNQIMALFVLKSKTATLYLVISQSHNITSCMCTSQLLWQQMEMLVTCSYKM